MREVDAQLELIKAVRSAGGVGTKLSNRFLIGVSDLLLKLPGDPPVLIEAKMADLVTSRTVKVQPTAIQLHFLREWDNVGMMTGVVSFITRKREFGVMFLRTEEWNGDYAALSVLTDDHAWCPMGSGHRQKLMLEEFQRFLEGD